MFPSGGKLALIRKPSCTLKPGLTQFLIVAVLLLTPCLNIRNLPLPDRSVPDDGATPYITPITQSSIQIETQPSTQNDVDIAGNSENIVAQPMKVMALDKKYCELPGDCVFDLGHNTGQDTLMYLKDLNTRVLAVEANPALVTESKQKFKDEIDQGRLKLVSVGLADSETASGKRQFWVNNVNSKFSSFLEHLGCRDGWGKLMAEGDHSHCNTIEMDIVSCKDMVEQFGTPVYLKIDIEGLDRVCLESIANLEANKRPKYVSVENVHSHFLNIMTHMGYSRFKAVNQARLELGVSADVKGYSGPWGEHAVDDLTGTRWQTKEEILERLPLNDTMVYEGQERKAWYDLHAMRI